MVITGAAGEDSWDWRPERAWKVRSENWKVETKDKKRDIRNLLFLVWVDVFILRASLNTKVQASCIQPA